MGKRGCFGCLFVCLFVLSLCYETLFFCPRADLPLWSVPLPVRANLPLLFNLIVVFWEGQICPYFLAHRAPNFLVRSPKLLCHPHFRRISQHCRSNPILTLLEYSLLHNHSRPSSCPPSDPLPTNPTVRPTSSRPTVRPTPQTTDL